MSIYNAVAPSKLKDVPVHGIDLYLTEERVALRKQGLNEKTAASVLLKLFISGNERCHTTDAP